MAFLMDERTPLHTAEQALYTFNVRSMLLRPRVISRTEMTVIGYHRGRYSYMAMLCRLELRLETMRSSGM